VVAFVFLKCFASTMITRILIQFELCITHQT